MCGGVSANVNWCVCVYAFYKMKNANNTNHNSVTAAAYNFQLSETNILNLKYHTSNRLCILFYVLVYKRQGESLHTRECE